MPLAFTGIFRNNPVYFGIFHQKIFTDINLVKFSSIYNETELFSVFFFFFFFFFFYNLLQKGIQRNILYIHTYMSTLKTILSLTAWILSYIYVLLRKDSGRVLLSLILLSNIYLYIYAV